MLKEVYRATITSQSYDDANYRLWLKEKNIVVIGRSTTDRRTYFPLLSITRLCDISKFLLKPQIPTHLHRLLISSSVVWGKPHIVTSDNCKKDAILISVRIWRNEFGKLHGDYEPSEIENQCGMVRSTPGDDQ